MSLPSRPDDGSAGSKGPPGRSSRNDDRSERICDASGFSRVSNGRFRGGWITRHYGAPGTGVHAVQMELAMRGYLREPRGPVTEQNWPVPLDDLIAAPLRVALRDVLDACIAFAKKAT